MMEKIRWMEHNTPDDKSNPAKHLTDHIDHSFTWKVICNAHKRKLARKILEAYFIGTMKPSLNNRCIKPHGITSNLFPIKHPSSSYFLV